MYSVIMFSVCVCVCVYMVAFITVLHGVFIRPLCTSHEDFQPFVSS